MSLSASHAIKAINKLQFFPSISHILPFFFFFFGSNLLSSLFAYLLILLFSSLYFFLIFSFSLFTFFLISALMFPSAMIFSLFLAIILSQLLYLLFILYKHSHKYSSISPFALISVSIRFIVGLFPGTPCHSRTLG